MPVIPITATAEMVRRALILLLALPLAGAAAALDPLSDDLAVAQAEQASAETRLGKLEAAAAEAGSTAQKLARDRAAASAAIDAAEARITAAEIILRARSQRLAAYRRSMVEVQRPVSSLLAGLAMMGERPPILALADRGGVEQLVRTRILLDSTLPYVRARSAALQARVREGEQLEGEAARARAALIADRALLSERQKGFIALEDKATRAAVTAGGLALTAGDRVLAGRDALDAAAGQRSATARRMAAELLAEDPVPMRQGGNLQPLAVTPFAFTLPADAPVVRGLAEIDRGGVRSRGITLGTARGAALIVPADGVVRFAGPFEEFDGIAIIEHGGGWISLIVNLATTITPGQRVVRGEVLGRALGPIDVELSRNGRHVSPAIIAGSSNALFKGR
ncbi:MAG: peptidoglycan DD-metalloendopeptidase family protein [Sphingomicrobium sp.]